MKKKIIATLLIFVSISFNTYAVEGSKVSTMVNVVNYNSIRNNIIEKNMIVKINENTIRTLEINYDNLKEAEKDIRDGIDGLYIVAAKYQEQLQFFSNIPTTEDSSVNAALLNINRMVQGIFSANLKTMYSNIYSMESQLDNMIDQKEDILTTIEKMKLNGEMVNNKMIWSGENLIFAYNAIDEKIKTIDKDIYILKEKIRVLKVQESLGNSLVTDIEAIELSIEGLNSTIETLNTQKINIKRQLNVLIGQSYNTQLEVIFTPELNDYDINSIDNKKDLNTTLKNSYELKLQKYEIDAKKVALERTKADEDDGENSNKYKLAEIDLENVNLQFEDAKRNYELKFQQTYEAVKDKQKVMALEEKKLAQEKTKLEAANKKYDLGMISKVEYDNVKSSYDLQGIKVETAKGDLFTAYRKYEWMLKGLSV